MVHTKRILFDVFWIFIFGNLFSEICVNEIFKYSSKIKKSPDVSFDEKDICVVLIILSDQAIIGIPQWERGSWLLITNDTFWSKVYFMSVIQSIGYKSACMDEIIWKNMKTWVIILYYSAQRLKKLRCVIKYWPMD